MKRLVVCLSVLVLAFPLANSVVAEDYITGWRLAKIKLFDAAGKFIGNVEVARLPKVDIKEGKKVAVTDRTEPALLGFKIGEELRKEIGTETVYVMQAQVIWTGTVCPTGYVTVAVASGQQNAGHNAGSSSGSGGCKPSTGGHK